MSTKEPVFLDEYRKSEPLCSYLRQQIGIIDYDDTDLANATNLSRKDIGAYLNPYAKPCEIPVGFIQNFYEVTHCDMDELNDIACSSSKLASPAKPTPSSKCKSSSESISASESEPSPKPCVKFSKKPATSIINIIKNAANDPHNFQFLSDVADILHLPPDTSKQIQSIIHDIVTQGMSSPNHQLLLSERSLAYYDRYIDSLPDEQDPKFVSPGQNATETDNKKALKSAAKRHQLLEEAQRAHFVDHNYHAAKKTYVKIIQKYHKTDEYYIACLNLLALNYSPLTKRNLSFGDTPTEKRITNSLNDTAVWKKICEIFDSVLLSPSGNPKRTRTRKVGDTYNQSKK